MGAGVKCSIQYRTNMEQYRTAQNERAFQGCCRWKSRTHQIGPLTASPHPD